MYCRYCGTQLADDIAFCIKCGKKTVKLRPRTQPADAQPTAAESAPIMPLVPPPVAKPGWQDDVKRIAAWLAKKAGPAAVKLASGAKAVFASLFAFTKHFDTGMWTLCGIFLGLEIVALIEVIASAAGSGLLFGFLQTVPTVLLLAWLLCLAIAQATVICAYNYKQTDEYKQAILAASAGETETEPMQAVTLIIEGEAEVHADGDALPEPPEPQEERPTREKLSQEAEDIIAELEKLSLTL